jgi:hypothetical protein
MAALGLLQDNQKKQAAAKQGQVDAARSSLVGGIGDMPPPAAPAQAAPGAGIGALAGLADKFGGAASGSPAASGTPAAAEAPPPAAPMGGKLLDYEDDNDPLSGGGASGNALRGGR